MPRPCPTAGQERTKSKGFSGHTVDKREGGHMADKVWRRSQSGHQAGHKADTGQDMADTWRRPNLTQGRHMADNVWPRGQSGLKADTWLTQVGHMADTWRTRFGGAAKEDLRRAQGGHKADISDTWRTTSGDEARAYRGQPFF